MLLAKSTVLNMSEANGLRSGLRQLPPVTSTMQCIELRILGKKGLWILCPDCLPTDSESMIRNIAASVDQVYICCPGELSNSAPFHSDMSLLG